MTAEEAASEWGLRRSGVRVEDALSRLPSGDRPRLSVESCGRAFFSLFGPSSVIEISGHSFNILFVGIMDFLLEIQTEVFTEEMLFLREMNRNNPF